MCSVEGLSELVDNVGVPTCRLTVIPEFRFPGANQFRATNRCHEYMQIWQAGVSLCYIFAAQYATRSSVRALAASAYSAMVDFGEQHFDLCTVNMGRGVFEDIWS